MCIRDSSKSEKKRFLTNKEDYVLFAGFGYGALFALVIFCMSSGIFGSSTTLDHKASQTFLDTGEECEDIEETPWIHIYPENDLEYFSLAGHNLVDGYAMMNYTITEIDNDWAGISEEVVKEVEDGRSYFEAPYETLGVGEYQIYFEVTIFNNSDIANASVVEDGAKISKAIDFELEINDGGFFSFLPFVDSDTKSEVRITDSGSRTCWTTKDLGDWGYILMAAELGGGRETAMLTGGTAGIPAWWMAFISLSLSAVTLLVVYPIMYKIYHQDTDDVLSRTHISRLVEDSLNKTAKRLNILVDWELYKIESRELSIDIMVPYKNTDATLSDSKDVRAEVLREILEEFAIFQYSNRFN